MTRAKTLIALLFIANQCLVSCQYQETRQYISVEAQDSGSEEWQRIQGDFGYTNFFTLHIAPGQAAHALEYFATIKEGESSMILIWHCMDEKDGTCDIGLEILDPLGNTGFSHPGLGNGSYLVKPTISGEVKVTFKNTDVQSYELGP